MREHIVAVLIVLIVVCLTLSPMIVGEVIVRRRRRLDAVRFDRFVARWRVRNGLPPS